MRKLLLLLLPFICSAQSTNYPGALDTNATLYVTADNVQSSLALSMSAGDNVAIVKSGAGFAVNMIATICDATDANGKCTAYEHMLITAVNGQALTVTRGVAGTSAATHASNKLVSVLIDAAHQTVLKNAVIAIETALGPNLSNVSALVKMPFTDVRSYGVKCDGITDDSAGVLQAMQDLEFGSGGVLKFPSGTCLINSQLLFQNDGLAIPKQHSIVLLGNGSWFSGKGLAGTAPTGGTILDLRYAGPLAKIDTRGEGVLEISGMTITDLGASSNPFLQTTNTTLLIHDTAWIGNPSKAQSSCDQDAIVLGGTSIISDGSSNAPFQGYGTVIQNNYFNRVRRAVYMRSWANGVVVRDNTVWTEAGGTAAIEVLGNSAPGQGNAGGVIAGNLIEVFGYNYAIKLDYAQQFTITGNNIYDDFHLPSTAAVLLTANTVSNYVEVGYSADALPYCSDAGSGNVCHTARPGGNRITTTAVPTLGLAVPSGALTSSPRLQFINASGAKVELIYGFLTPSDGVTCFYDRTNTAARMCFDAKGHTTFSNSDVHGAKTLAAGAGTVTFANAYTSAPVCTCTDQTAANAVKCSTTTTALTIAGTATDSIAYMCFGQ